MKLINRNPKTLLARHVGRAGGFTLLEIMIVVAIIAILAAIVYPNYIHYMVGTRRTAAESCLSQYADYMERFYTTNLRYDQTSGGTANTLPLLACAQSAQTGDHYTYQYAAGEPTKTTYKIEAVPKNGGDPACGTLSLTQAGQRDRTGQGSMKMCW